MPLITSWANRDAEILDDRSVEQRTYRVGQADDFIDYKEVVEKNVNRWLGFDEAAASAHIDTNQQPADVTIANSWTMNEDQRVVGSYTITRSQEKKTVSVIGSTPPPTIGSVTFSVTTNTNTIFPFNLTMSTTTSGAVIRYRVDSYNGSQLVTGSWQVSSGTSQTISVNTTNIAGGASIGGIKYHKYVIIEAYAYRVLQTGTYEGARSSHIYGYRVPNLQAIQDSGWNPLGDSSGANPVSVSLPFSLTITATGSNVVVWAGARYGALNNNKLISNMQNRGGPSATITITALDRFSFYYNAFPAVELDGVWYRDGSVSFNPSFPPFGNSTLPFKWYRLP